MFESVSQSLQERLNAQKKRKCDRERIAHQLEAIFDHRAKNIATVKTGPQYGKPN